MKKKLNDEQDIASLIINMQAQLSFLEKKIDTLISQAQEKPFKEERHQKPFQRFDNFQRQRDARPDNNYRERTLHKAICADCNKECEVPFKPSQDRPVYCKDCFSKRKVGSSFKGGPRGATESKPWEKRDSGAGSFDKPRGGEKKKFFRKKRPTVKRRKGRG